MLCIFKIQVIFPPLLLDIVKILKIHSMIFMFSYRLL